MIVEANKKAQKTFLNSLFKYGALVFCSAFMAIYLELFRENVLYITHGAAGVILRSLPLFIVFLVLGYLVLKKNGYIINRLFKWRYYIGILLFCIALIFDLSGSSIGIWENLLPSSDGANILWGKYQGIRGDEWGIKIPFYLSQEQNSFAPINDMIRGTATSVTLSPSLPSYSFVACFNPLFWGYLLFGVAKGLAWLWSMIYIGTFLVTIELFLIITNRNKTLSILAAFLITFSTCSQWWNSCDLLLFGESILVCMFYFLTSRKVSVKTVFSILFCWLCFCFLFIAYPAWQVPYFYIFLVIGVWTIVSNRKSVKESFRLLFYRNVFLGVLPILAFICFLVLFVFVSVLIFKEASLSVEGMSNAIYPGQRFSIGGEKPDYALDWIPSMFFSISQSGFDYGNECELSAFLSLFPLGFVLSCAAIYKRKNGLLVSLMLLGMVYFVYFSFGIPEFVSKITLLSMTTSSRIILPWGYINICLLILSVNILFDSSGKLKIEDSETLRSRRLYFLLGAVSVLILLASCLLGYFAPTGGIPGSFWTGRLSSLLVLFFLSVACSLAYMCISSRDAGVKLFSMVLSGLVFVIGISINPIQQGVSVITDNEAYITIEDIADEDPDALWIAEGGPYYSNFCAAAGAKTLSSTNTYPNIDLWNELDPSGDYEEVYLRYANINVDIGNEFDDETFELVNGDAILLNLTPADLKKIGVKYLLADEGHDDVNGIHFEELYSAASPSREFIVYRLSY